MDEQTLFPKELIGERIREIRKEKLITMSDLASRIELSQGMLSQIENGVSGPSLDTLWKLSNALDVPVFYFFKKLQRKPVEITRSEQQKSITMLHPNVHYRILSTNLSKKIEILELSVDPGCFSELESLSHNGEEWGYIIKGKLEVLIEEERHILNAGDTIHFDSKMEHKFYNPNSTVAIGIWIMVPTN